MHIPYRERDEDFRGLAYPSSDKEEQAWKEAKEDAEGNWLDEINAEFVIRLVKKIQEIIRKPGALEKGDYTEKYFQIRGELEDLREAYGKKEADKYWRLYLEREE